PYPDLSVLALLALSDPDLSGYGIRGTGYAIAANLHRVGDSLGGPCLCGVTFNRWCPMAWPLEYFSSSVGLPWAHPEQPLPGLRLCPSRQGKPSLQPPLPPRPR